MHKALDAVAESGLLALLPGREAKLLFNLYADNVVIFANLVRHEINSLVNILNRFRGATGLCINPTKSSGAPIRCEEIDLDNVLRNFGGQRVDFPLRFC